MFNQINFRPDYEVIVRRILDKTLFDVHGLGFEHVSYSLSTLLDSMDDRDRQIFNKYVVLSLVHDKLFIEFFPWSFFIAFDLLEIYCTCFA